MDPLLIRKAGVFALVTCAMLTCGCQSGVNSSVAPSAINSVSASTESNSSIVMPGDLLTTQDAPVSYPINEAMVNGFPSGYSGTCTVANTHTGGLRVKVDGQGGANSLIKFHVVDVSDPLLLRTTEYVDVNQQGAFRTNWQPVNFPGGDNLQCWLMSGVDVLANSSNFPAP